MKCTAGQQMFRPPLRGSRVPYHLSPVALPRAGLLKRCQAVVAAQSVRNAAFTLIELMVVISLIGILSAMIIPEMQGTYEEALLRSTSRQLVNLCNLAYSRAVSVQQIHRIRMDPRSGRFLLEKRDTKAKGGEDFVPADEVAGSHGELDTRISITFRRPAENQSENGDAGEPSMATVDRGDRLLIVFYPDGTADASMIELRDRQGFGLLLRISPVTARVRVIELPRE